MVDQIQIPDRISSLSNVSTSSNGKNADIAITVQPPQACLLVTARNGKIAALTKLLNKKYGISAPKPGQSKTSGKISIRWAGYEQWLLISNIKDTQSFFAEARKAFSKVASVVDQSHGRVTIVIKGKYATSVLAKGTPVDLHKSVFKNGACATTQIAKIPVHLSKINESHFEVSLYRSFAESFWHWATLMSREYR